MRLLELNIKSFLLMNALLLVLPVNVYAQECVVLLHGLARSSLSMKYLEYRLSKEDYKVVNIDYPSKKFSIEALSNLAIPKAISQCEVAKTSKLNFVTHSMGGILLRQYYSQYPKEKLNRVVMLGPPNQGSELVDEFKELSIFEFINGPAGMQLGTNDKSLPKALGPVNFDLGVIAGRESINFLASSILPEEDDGKVAVKNTKVDGMCGFVALPVTHTFMMNNEMVISEIVSFLKDGLFKSDDQATNACLK